MATIENKLNSRQPLSERRGLDNVNRQRLNKISNDGFGDQEFGRDMYNIMDSQIKPPKEMITVPSFPTILFIFMIVVDILDFIFGLFDWSGVAWLVRAILLNAIPTIIAFAWAGKTGKKYKEEMGGKIKKMSSTAKRLKGGGGGKIGGSKKLGEVVDKLITKVLTRKAGKKVIGFLIAGLIPIISLFALWSVFIYGFHKQRVKIANQTNKSFEDMYKLQNQQN